MLEINRRNFIKVTALTGAGLTLTELGIDVSKLYAGVDGFKLSGSKEYTSICTFCACGCGMVCSVKDGKLINLEGDSDHIVSEGGLCSKGASMSVIPNSSSRVKTPLYRAPGTDKWQEISWKEAIDKVANKIKSVRDETWIEDEVINGKSYKVRRTDHMSFIGSAQVHNEECYIAAKLARLLGVVYLEHQARLCHSSTVPALNASFGRGAMTNSWNDLKNAKVILIEGCNPAENHPLSMKWVMRAKDNGATVIHVDPRYTRTSKIADIHAQIRPGTDIAFLGSIINYILENNLYDKDYVLNHTNAMFLIDNKFEFSDGLFSGYVENEFKYNKDSWKYQTDAKNEPKKAKSLDDENSVFQQLKNFYSRYNMQIASDITGISSDKIKQIADIFINSKPGTIMYALGMTQHTVGVQNIRAFAILQLLLGNMGKAGGGINALRGEPNVQGSTDFALLFDYLPGYLSNPTHIMQNIDIWTNAYGTSRAKNLINLLKAWFGDNATKDNDFAFSYLPKYNGNENYSIYRIFETATEGKMKFSFIMGQNPMVTNPNLNLVFDGLEKMDTLVVSDLFLTETACFWEKPGVDPKTINTEVIFLPAASFLEKDGSLINSSRMVQWRYTNIKPVGEAKSDLVILDMLFTRIKELYSTSKEKKDEIFKLAAWNYPQTNMSEEVLKEINGYNIQTGALLKGIPELQADGTTSSGNWLYAGIFANDENKSKRRDYKTDPSGLGLFTGYAWTWPSNMRILYNRASCDMNGTPLDEKNRLIWWDKSEKKWTGYDIPDVISAKDAPDSINGKKAFRMNSEGCGRLFSAIYGDVQSKSYTPADGPLSEFYEPVESPTDNALHPKVPINPCLKYPRIPSLQLIGNKKDFPYVLCTSSISEQWCGGAETRNVPWLNELVKETFIEMPVRLASKLGLKNGDWAIVRSARGEVKVKTMVTERIQPLMINSSEVSVVWMPYNWGFKGLSTAASTNLLTIDAGDPNTWIQETKACLVDIRRG